MPTLPSKDQIVRLDMSKESNKDKVLTAGTMIEIDKLSLADRVTVMNFAFNPEQIKQHDEWLLITERTSKTISDYIDRYGKKKKPVYTTRFENGFLFINGISHDFRSNMNAYVFLKALFKGPRTNLSKPRNYRDFYSDHRDILDRADISCEKIRYIRKHILDKTGAKDFFPDRAVLAINPKYLS